MALTESTRDEPGNDANECNELWEGLSAGVRSFAQREPERVKGLVREMVRSDKVADRGLAASTVPGLIDHDYPFTREVLATLYDDKDANVSELTGLVVMNLSQLKLTPEQRVDFEARLHFRDSLDR